MKLKIEINDYEKLKNMAEAVMDDKCRKTKRIQFYVTSLLLIASLTAIVNAIYYKDFIILIVSLILTSVCLCCLFNIFTDSGAYLKRIYVTIQKMQEVSDEQSYMQIESWIRFNDVFEFQYFDKDNIMQKSSIPYEKRYIHKYDYYKIAGKFNKNEDNYIFYLYEPYKKGESL